MILRRLLLATGLFLASHSIDLCELVNKDYCFYFGESSCYLKICECEQEKCTSEATDTCLHSYWCDANGEYNVNESKIYVVDMSCQSLSNRCLERNYFNGFCYLYDRQACPENPEIEQKAQSRNLSETCQRWGQTCVKKWDKHFACRQFLKLCHAYTLPPRPDNNTFELNDVRHFEHSEHGVHWERKMISRCRHWQHQCVRHNNTKACGRVDKRCEGHLSNSTIIRKEEDSFSEEEDRTIQLILRSTDSTENRTHSRVETSTGPNYVRNMKNRCKAWRAHCKRHPESHQCETYFRRCSEYSAHFAEDLTVGTGNFTLI